MILDQIDLHLYYFQRINLFQLPFLKTRLYRFKPPFFRLFPLTTIILRSSFGLCAFSYRDGKPEVCNDLFCRIIRAQVVSLRDIIDRIPFCPAGKAVIIPVDLHARMPVVMERATCLLKISSGHMLMRPRSQ